MSDHASPQISTSCALVSESGSAAGPLSGQGNEGPNRLSLPQFPLIAHIPALCSLVSPSFALNAVVARHAVQKSAALRQPKSRNRMTAALAGSGGLPRRRIAGVSSLGILLFEE